MKHKKIFRMLAVALTLALMLVAIPASVVMALPYTVNIENTDSESEYYDPPDVTGIPMGTIDDSIRVWGTGTGGMDVHIYFSSQNVAVGADIDDEVTAYEWLATILVLPLGDQFNITSLHVPDELIYGTDDEDVHGGVYYIYITTTTSKDIKAKTTFTVTGIAEITTFTPVNGTVGTEVKIEGEGFAPGEAIIVEYDGDEIDIDSGDTEADTNGEFTLYIIIPESVYGENTITIIGEDSLAEFEETFSIIPEIIIDPVMGEAGINVDITGTGFDRYGDVVITFNGVEVKEKRAGSDGSFDTYFTVPQADEGTYDVVAEDEDDDDIVAGATFTVEASFNPEIALDEDSGNVGDTITVTGTDFTPDDEVTVYFDGSEVATADTDEDGNFTATFGIPASPTGEYDIEVVDGDEFSATKTFAVEPEMTVTPLTGPMGDSIAVSGTGFGAGEDITILYGAAVITPAAPITTGSNGTFSGSYLVPAIAAGSYTVNVTDGTSSLTTSFVVKAGITVSPTSGKVGSGVGVAGYGFGASKTISIFFNNKLVTPTAPITSGTDGSFSGGAFNVPVSPAGIATLIISDGTSSVTTGFVVLADTTISPVTSATSPGYVGMQLTISGNGHEANADIDIEVTYAGELVLLASTTANSSGHFSIAVTIPESAGGEHTITVSSNGVTAEQFTFIMESTPPAAPMLMYYFSGNRAEAPISFDWNEVSDVSLPVTYDLVIYTVTGTVETKVLELTGLEDTDYTLTEAEVLKLVPLEKNEYYYWHVQAVDSAGNVSSWSDADTFTIAGGGGWPGWLTYLLIGLGVVVLFVFALWLGRRIAFSSY